MVNPLYAFGILDWIWDLIALLVTFMAFFVLIRITIYLQRQEKIPSAVAPYVFQIFGGPLFLICWLLYSGVFFSRYMAAVVPAFFIFYSILIVFFDWQDEGFVESMGHEGNKYNLLTGPFFYLIIMVFAVFYLWYVPIDLNGTPLFSTFIPTGILIFSPLTARAGSAALVTERNNKRNNRILAKKNVEGSIAMFCLCLLSTVGILGVYWIVLEPAFASINITLLIIPIVVTAIIATIVEFLSHRHVDIILIPIVVFITLAILSVIGFYPYWLVYPFRPPF